MKLSQLLHIVRFLKRNIQCPECKKIFTNEDIHIVDFYDTENIVMLTCVKCNTHIEVNVGLYEGEESPTITIKQTEGITKNDVENITSILSSHKGGLSKLFNVKNSK